MSLLFLSCKTHYKTAQFSTLQTPKAPDYSQTDAWAVLPGNYPSVFDFRSPEDSTKRADVFYIYPTLFSDPKNTGWNADVFNAEIRKEVWQQAVKYQASAWMDAGRLFVPFYRQAHYRIFVDPYKKGGEPAWELAYQDVRRAFQYYLDHHHQDRPIIVASHSQGSMHAKRLLAEFFDDQPLQEKLVAAYLVGTKIEENQYNSLPALWKPDAVGGILSWNTYKKGKLPKRFDTWFKGGLTSNPITWDRTQKTSSNTHKGVLYRDLEIYPQSLRVERLDGMLWSTVPYVPKRFLLKLIKNYHFADINLFWEDIRQNAILRVNSWYKQHQKS